MTEKSLGPFPSKTPDAYQPIVKSLKDLIDGNNWKDKFEEAVYNAQKTGVENMRNIGSLIDYYNFLNYLVLWVPKENETGTFVYNMLCTMYFVLDQKSVIDFQSPIKPSSYPPPPLTALSEWIIDFAKAMGQFLDTPQSLTEESLETFRTAENYNFDDYPPPPGGWLGHSFNEFFARKFLPGTRPIDGPSNPAIILLANSKYANDFGGGKFMHAFLAPYDYHRLHAPVDGKVLEAKVIPGQTYLEVNVKKHSNDKYRLIPTRALYAPNSSGYQFCQARGLIVIDSPKVGKVAVLPIGMCQVSSVVLSVKEEDEVKKGDEISYFQFGGSDIVLLFQAQSKVKILAGKHKHYRVGEQIAIAHIAK
ncbi:phosphatidylserine decarboxylase-related protein [Rhizophagus irregularis]|uniref:Phosphatidylserine decarboxylase-related protein n=1 Tax=Rhizophagus irregularis TaxID=588596 RepID=A0A2N1M429_9GLOM|nr:phosphatidylserine decarboxylase-related protein [Rhizophagus irregularis]